MRCGLASMVTYYLKDPRSREKHEVQWTEDRVSVVSVKSTAAEKFNIPINEQRNDRPLVCLSVNPFIETENLHNIICITNCPIHFQT